MSKHIPRKVRDGITYPSPNLNVEVWEWISELNKYGKMLEFLEGLEKYKK